jgi:hypothetical protein
MSGTLLRFGLWIVLIVLALYVLGETYTNSALQEYASGAVLQKAGIFGLVLIAAGWVASFFDKVDLKTDYSRCLQCRKLIPRGELYCRQHLRRVLDVEHDRTHNTRLR